MISSDSKLVCPNCSSADVKKKIGWWIVLVALLAAVILNQVLPLSRDEPVSLIIDGVTGLFVLAAIIAPMVDKHVCRQCGNRWKK